MLDALWGTVVVATGVWGVLDILLSVLMGNCLNSLRIMHQRFRHRIFASIHNRTFGGECCQLKLHAARRSFSPLYRRFWCNCRFFRNPGISKSSHFSNNNFTIQFPTALFGHGCPDWQATDGANYNGTYR
ncbi:hypothetical protein M0G74_04315 [Microbulbifer sp. CAU 1566]|uniref:hypothetical protein n=1 Tax=Microbulbifer sp. CAU 1566 TaxID=2933269 RepID=UPI002006B3F3|nr:hypothetical protein [Microbulbifer sp. CAU 1566]MCK7596494.1 hypothetical protein [Microbulbifer sp. CAU 1566]